MGCVVLLLLLIVGVASCIDLRVGAFNCQVFGVTKMAKPNMKETLKALFLRYDILFFQEIRDITENAFTDLMTFVGGAR